MKSTIQVAAFLKRNYPEYSSLDRASFLPWLEFYIENKRCGVVTNQGRIVGVGLFRTMHNLDEWFQPFHQNDFGNYLFVDCVVAKSKEAMKALWNLVWHLSGPRAYIAFQRFKYGHDLRVYPFSRFHNHMTRSFYGRRRNSSPSTGATAAA